ncbi:helix-turn-helix domain-containing protein [Cytobacillus kochii]|uniref:helix-turn-helix domain-containing protein n=1 Tax=Cytobacillus kochii TaxID=859143 RepID=UPI001CD74518|nr:helix-turn-helix domain-containing protein [Cytobacillus kochii]MCA1027314.1 helix-turn-helix domain-containing protein [Cytobacillus kochii]
MKKEIMDVADLQMELNIGKRQAYELANSGQFHVVRVGQRIKISRRVFEAWLNGEHN